MSLADTVKLPANRLSRSQIPREAALCRVCNVLSAKCLPLFRQHSICGKITTLAKVLSYCTGLEILEAEHYLPHHICPGCMVRMQSSLQFKRSVHRMDRMLRQRHLEKANKSLKDDSLKTGSGEKVREEFIFVLDEQDATEEQHLEIELENREETVPKEVKSGIGLEQAELETESENQTKNWTEVTEEKHLEAELNEDELYEIVEEPEEPEDPEQPPLADDSESKPPQSAIGRSQRKRTQNPSLKCQICGKQLSTSNSFKYHMQLHGTATPFVCQICGESFKTRNAHDGHVTLHDPNNPNRCPTCGKVYRQASSLRSHLLTHSGIKPFECSVCGKRLTQKSGYKKHMLTHTGEKPHGCDICGRSFRYSSNLIAHKRCHSQEKPHECQVCRKRSFGSTSELNRHMLVHSSERPFACAECGKSFKRQVSLGLHQQSHKAGKGKWGKVGARTVQEDHEES